MSGLHRDGLRDRARPSEDRPGNRDVEERVALGEVLRSRAADVARMVTERWEQRRPADAPTTAAKVLTDIARTTETATIAVADFLVTGRLPTEEQARVWNATGKAPLRDTITLADLTKLYLFWRDATLQVSGAEAQRLQVCSATERLATTAIRAGADASIVRMAKTFDAERLRLQHRIAEEQERLRYQALHDALTGLPNRVLFLDRLTHALAASDRRHSTAAVLFIDIDDFKAINDEGGHVAGDELLQLFAERLRAAVRRSDTVARFAGDEFLVLCEALGDATATAWTVAQRIEAALARPFVCGGRDLQVSASIGVAVSSPGIDADALLIEADRAMYVVKQHRRARCDQAS